MGGSPQHTTARSGSRSAEDDDDVVSLSTASASVRGSTTAATLSRRAAPNCISSYEEGSDDESLDNGVELIHITSSGKTAGEFVPLILSEAPVQVAEPPRIYDRLEALKDRGLHRTIKTPSTRREEAAAGGGAARGSYSDSPPKRIPPTSPPRPVFEAQTHGLVERALEREAATRYAARSPYGRDGSPLPRAQPDDSPPDQGSQSSSATRFEHNKSARRQLIDQAVAFRALQRAAQQQGLPAPGGRITSPSRGEVVAPASKESFNYRSSQARQAGLGQSQGPLLYA
jgi:hypothetical protein